MIWGIKIWILYAILLFINIVLTVLTRQLKKIAKDEGAAAFGWAFGLTAAVTFGIIMYPLYSLIKEVPPKGLFIIWIIFLVASFVFTVWGWKQIRKHLGKVSLAELVKGRKQGVL